MHYRNNHLDANNNLGALLYGLDRLEEAEKSWNNYLKDYIGKYKK